MLRSPCPKRLTGVSPIEVGDTQRDQFAVRVRIALRSLVEQYLKTSFAGAVELRRRSCGRQTDHFTERRNHLLGAVPPSGRWHFRSFRKSVTRHCSPFRKCPPEYASNRVNAHSTIRGTRQTASSPKLDHSVPIKPNGNTSRQVFQLPPYWYFSVTRQNAISRMKQTSGHDQPGANSIFRKVHDVVQLEFSHQVAAVNIHRAGRNVQFSCDVGRALALGKQGGHLNLAPR